MNYNPYAAPQGAGAPPPPSPYANRGGERLPWEIGEVLGRSWEIFKNNWVVLIFSILLTGAVAAVPFVGLIGYMLAKDMRPEGPLLEGGSEAIACFSLLVVSFFEVGLVRIWLAAARGDTPDFGLLFSGGDRYLSLLGLRAIVQSPAMVAGALSFAATLGGSASVILVAARFRHLVTLTMAVLQALGLYYASFFVVDGGLGPVRSLEKAWATAAGERGKLFLFALATLGIVVASTMCCLVPSFLAYPTMFVASAIVFLRMTGGGTPPDARGYDSATPRHQT